MNEHREILTIPQQTRTCRCCHRELSLTDFWTYKDPMWRPFSGLCKVEHHANKCKECYREEVDIYNPTTFIQILKEFNVPYIPEEWALLCTRYGENGNIIGRYLSKMKLPDWYCYSFEDGYQLTLQQALRDIKRFNDKQDVEINGIL